MKQRISLLMGGNHLLFLTYELVILSFFLPNRVNSIALLILGLSSFLPALKNRRSFITKENIVSILLFTTLCVGLLYTENKKEGYAIVERSVCFVLIPFLITPFKLFSRQQKQALLTWFIGTVFIASLYCFGLAIYEFFESGTAYPTGQTGHFTYNRFMHQRLSSNIGMHAIYLSFYCSFAAIAALHRVLFTNRPKRATLVWNTFLVMFFAGFIFLLKSSLFAFVFPLSCILIVFLRVKNHLLSPKYALAFLLMSLLSIVFSYKGIQSKLDNFNTSFNFEDQSMRPLAMRLAFWTSAWEVIQEHPFLGAGTGDGQDELVKEYQRVHFSIGEKNNFNAHNMYLQYWISNGVLMPLLFVVFLSMLFVKAVQHRNFLFFAFTLYFTFFSLTESTMLKQKGILFFVFFAFLFISDPPCWALPTSKSNENTTST